MLWCVVTEMTFLVSLNTVLGIMAVIYWCVSKDFGTYLLMGWSGNRLVNGVLKVTACAYRPWIRDARIVPYGNSMTTATARRMPMAATQRSFWGCSATHRISLTVSHITNMPAAMPTNTSWGV